MKHPLPIILLVAISTIAYAQNADTIKIQLALGQEALPGASLVVRHAEPPIGTTSDQYGTATLIIPRDKDEVTISFIGPYVRLKIVRPTDSIYFDLNSKKATFYNNGKRLKTRKQIVKRY